LSYQPASNATQTPSITHLATVYYKNEGLDVLRQMNRFMGVCEPDNIPARVGKTVQWFRYSTFTANTNASAEGVVGSGLSLTTSTISATVDQFSDFLSISRMLKTTAIDDIKTNASRELSYRASISVDTITRTEFDSNSGAVGTLMGSSFTRQDVINSVGSLRAANVRPKDDGNFALILHPYITIDLMTDNTSGSFIELSKYTRNQAGDYPTNGEVGMVGGCRAFESTNVGTSGSAPNVLYYTYIVGKGAVGAVALAGNGPQQVEDPSKEMFRLNVIDTDANPADPEGQISTYISYWFAYAVKTLDSTNYRYRILKPDAATV
jgi:N4-gp56 family major capsid protein